MNQLTEEEIKELVKRAEELSKTLPPYRTFKLMPTGLSTYGWICPRCHKVHAPDVKSCNCEFILTC